MREGVSICLQRHELGRLVRVPNAYEFEPRKGRIRSWLDKKLWGYLRRTGSAKIHMSPKDYVEEVHIDFGRTVHSVMNGLVDFLNFHPHAEFDRIYIGRDHFHRMRRDENVGPLIEFDVPPNQFFYEGMRFCYVPYAEPDFILPIIKRRDRV